MEKGCFPKRARRSSGTSTSVFMGRVCYEREALPSTCGDHLWVCGTQACDSLTQTQDPPGAE